MKIILSMLCVSVIATLVVVLVSLLIHHGLVESKWGITMAVISGGGIGAAANEFLRDLGL